MSLKLYDELQNASDLLKQLVSDFQVHPSANSLHPDSRGTIDHHLEISRSLLALKANVEARKSSEELLNCVLHQSNYQEDHCTIRIGATPAEMKMTIYTARLS